MAGNFWTAPLQQLAAGASIAQNTFTAAQGLPVGETASNISYVYGGALNPGSIITVEAWGVASNTGTPTLALGVYYGGAVGAAVGGVALKVSAVKTTTTGMTNWPWWLWYHGRVTATGTVGAIMGYGRWRLPTSATAWTEFNLDENAPVSVAIDTTINKTIVIGAAWGTSSVSNAITCHSCLVRVDG